MLAEERSEDNRRHTQTLSLIPAADHQNVTVVLPEMGIGFNRGVRDKPPWNHRDMRKL